MTTEQEMVAEEKRNGQKLNVITTLCIFLIVQLCTAIWWAGSMQTKLEERTKDRIMRSEAVERFATQNNKISNNKEMISQNRDLILRSFGEVKAEIVGLREQVMRTLEK